MAGMPSMNGTIQKAGPAKPGAASMGRGVGKAAARQESGGIFRMPEANPGAARRVCAPAAVRPAA